MIGGVMIEIGWCGWRSERGLFPVIRLGIVQVGTYHGSFLDQALGVVQALRQARDELRAVARAIRADAPVHAAPAGGVSSLKLAPADHLSAGDLFDGADAETTTEKR